MATHNRGHQPISRGLLGGDRPVLERLRMKWQHFGFTCDDYITRFWGNEVEAEPIAQKT
jgi:hypothetical protein